MLFTPVLFIEVRVHSCYGKAEYRIASVALGDGGGIVVILPGGEPRVSRDRIRS